MPLRDPIDIPFSELKNNCEPKQAWIMESGSRKAVSMTCYGYLPDGRSYGIVKMGVWFDPGYYENYAVLVTPEGECRYFDEAYERLIKLQELDLSAVNVNMFKALNNQLINDGCGLFRGRQILPFEHLSRFQNDLID